MNDKLYNLMNWPLVEGIEYTDIDNPFDILGQRVTEDGLLIQAFVPQADRVEVKYLNKVVEMQKMDESGFFAVLIDSKIKVEYKLIAISGEEKKEYYDPYQFEPTIPIKELKKFNAGINYGVYDVMGAHPFTVNNVKGVRFAVWAPYAVRVSVVGSFNNWDGRYYQMMRREDTGVFELFIPGLETGCLYKYEIKIKGDENILKADPYANKMENLPGDASVISDISEYDWTDQKFIENRSANDVTSLPIAIYELNVATFVKENDGSINYSKVAKPLADYVKKMGYTHIEIMPIMEYINEDSLGYETSDFYSVTSRYGEAKDFMYFVNYMHSQNIGVILDWTPNQFDSTESGLRSFDGSCLYEHMEPKKGFNKKNGTYLFNYARPEVTNYLIANAFLWVNKFHIDGLKVAKTASMLYLDYDKEPGEWIPNIYGGNENLDAIEFLKHFNSIIHKLNKGFITIAEDNSGFPKLTGEVDEECIGFDFKWNEEWRKELINYLGIPPYMRESYYNDISLSMIYQYSDNFVVGFPSCEFVNGQSALVSRMAGDTEERKFANMRLALGYMYSHPGKKMLFMGQDFAQYNEWLPGGNLDFDILKTDKHKQINDFVKALNNIYVSEPALYELDNDVDGFEWINNISARESILTFVRKGKNYDLKNAEDEMLLVVCNFDVVDREDYKIGVPKKGKYKEILNSDNVKFGGKGFINSRLKQSKLDECDGREESIRINVPALSISIFKFSKADIALKGNKEAKENVKKTKTVKSTSNAGAKASNSSTTKTIKKSKSTGTTVATKGTQLKSNTKKVSVKTNVTKEKSK